MREQVMQALLTLVTGAYPWVTPPSRRIKLWSDVPPSTRPAAFLFEGKPETYEWPTQRIIPRRSVVVDLIVYFDAHDPATVGAAQINTFMDALDAALVAAPGDPTGRLTLGGLVSDCRIDGPVRKVPGDLDGDALVWCPIKIVFP